MIQDPILFGKDLTKKVVGIEPGDGFVDILTVDTNGNVHSERKPNKFWILSPKQIGPKWVKLEGNLHFKYGRQFDTREEFDACNKGVRYKHGTFSIYDAKEATMVNRGFTYYKGLKPSDLSVLSFDIETTGLDPNHKDAKVLLISNTFRSRTGEKTRKLFRYDHYETHLEMFRAWSDWIREMDPDVLTGYNVLGFDLNYMYVLGGNELKLGRDGSAIVQDSYTSKYRLDQAQNLDYHKIFCHGREIIDSMFLAYKYDVAAKKYDSYRLKRIIEIEGLQKENREFYDASQIRFNYTNPVEWEKIIRYCEDDSDDGLAVYELMSTPFFYMTQMIPKSFQSVVCSATGSQINSIMMRAYLQDKHSLPKATEASEFAGAISLGNPGIYNNVGKVDVASLYPSIMIQYEVCDERKDPKKHFPTMVRTLTDLRLEYKKLGKTDKVYDDMQNAFKILINSAYGFLGTNGLLFNAPDKAAFITKTGQDILQKAIVWATGYDVKREIIKESKSGDHEYAWVKGDLIKELETPMMLVNADTDSISFCKHDQSEITEEQFGQYLKEINALYPPRIRWEHDGVFNRVIVIRAKNYILYDGKKIKTKGSGLKASTKSPAMKEFIGRCIEVLVHGTGDIAEIYQEYVNEIVDIKDISRWCSRKTISEKVLTSERANESKVRDLMEGTELAESDRIRVFYLPDDSLCLQENFTGVYNRTRLFKNLFDTVKLFETVLPIKSMVKNYSLKGNIKELNIVDFEQKTG